MHWIRCKQCRQLSPVEYRLGRPRAYCYLCLPRGTRWVKSAVSAEAA
jgi:hypothetical protein